MKSSGTFVVRMLRGWCDWLGVRALRSCHSPDWENKQGNSSFMQLSDAVSSAAWDQPCEEEVVVLLFFL